MTAGPWRHRARSFSRSKRSRHPDSAWPGRSPATRGRSGQPHLGARQARPRSCLSKSSRRRWCRRETRSRFRSKSYGRPNEKAKYKLTALSPPTGLSVAETELGERQIRRRGSRSPRPRMRPSAPSRSPWSRRLPDRAATAPAGAEQEPEPRTRGQHSCTRRRALIDIEVVRPAPQCSEANGQARSGMIGVPRDTGIGWFWWFRSSVAGSMPMQ